MLFKYLIQYPLLALIFHVLLGFLAKFLPIGFTLYYLFVLAVGVHDIIRFRDKALLTAHYALYMMGMEIVYRIGGSYLFWELGKYCCTLLLLVGIIYQKNIRKNRKSPFLIYLCLIIPGLFVAILYGYADIIYLRKVILQNLSGPLCLFLAGIYFYHRPITQRELFVLLKSAILPSVSLVTLLFLGKQISQIDFYTTSNFAASGGFGPNQVSTIIGWGIVILIFAQFHQIIITLNRSLDLLLLGLLLFRGLLTFSRGGMISACLAAFLPIVILFFTNKSYRIKFSRVSIRLGIAIGVISMAAVVVNNITNNFLLYRYQGKSTSEVLYGIKPKGKPRSYLSGREEVFSQELHAFINNPMFGVGVGRGAVYREEHFEIRISSHNEISRLLGEHGMLGAVIILSIFIMLPIGFFFKISGGFNRHWFLQCYLLAMFTLLHSGMRLAFPSIIFCIALLLIRPSSKEARIAVVS